MYLFRIVCSRFQVLLFLFQPCVTLLFLKWKVGISYASCERSAWACSRDCPETALHVVHSGLRVYQPIVRCGPSDSQFFVNFRAGVCLVQFTALGKVLRGAPDGLVNTNQSRFFRTIISSSISSLDDNERISKILKDWVRVSMIHRKSDFVTIFVGRNFDLESNTE